LAFVVGAACVVTGLVIALVYLRGITDDDDVMTEEERQEIEAHAL